MTIAYYNEFDAKKAAWLRQLIKAELIPAGEVDERSIRDVRAEDLEGFAQCHFFAGIGVWPHCLRRAGWPDQREVWTGSPPCQPFSVAGKKKAQADDRHLWPELARLIRERRPQSFFGEQVASKDGLAWIDLVYADLESAGYAVWAVDICAAGFGAAHIRQRLAIVADTSVERHDGRRAGEQGTGPFQSERSRDVGGMGDAENIGRLGGADDGNAGRRQRPSGQAGEAGGLEHASRRGLGEFGDAPQPQRGGHPDGANQIDGLGDAAIPRSLPGPQRSLHCGEEGAGPRDAELKRSGGDGVTLGDTIGAGLEGFARHGHNWAGWQDEARPIAPAGVVNGHWLGAELVWCRDQKWRPVEPATFPLVDGAAERLVRMRDPGAPINAQATAEARTLRLKGYGDAIVSDCYVAVIEAAMELFDEQRGEVP